MSATTREITAADLDAATALWAAAENARKAQADQAQEADEADQAGQPDADAPATAAVDVASLHHETQDDELLAERVARRLRDPTAFGVVAEVAGQLVALAVGAQATADDGLSFEPVAGLVHVSMVAVCPQRWRRGLGRLALEELERLARDRGFIQAQLWTHQTNARGQRLYEQLGWFPSGRTKEDEHGAVLLHYVRAL